ncbi:hypothetical protein K523DRAFT_346266 [Schizophyllum commune Tattone D]|nr:hypothetical protein K523DRAFT_346266 [Schizophyllum commune Tattone D]
MGQDLRDYSVVGMPFQDFLDAFLPHMTLSAQPHASFQAQAGRGIGEPTMRGKKRARTEDTMSSQPISYGRYIKLDDDGLLRVSTDAPAFQGIKVLPDIFQDINGGEQQLECSDASANEVLISIQEAHIVSERIFSLVVFVNDGYSRLIRADRDGLIVTRKVKWAASDNSLNLKSLDDLTRRFEGITKAQQGIDPTVRPLLAEEAEYRERAIQALKKHTRRAMTEPGKELAVYKIGVPCAEVEVDLRWFYTCGPESNPDGLRKRATRGYVAWDPIMDNVVFIKDSWRSVAGDLLPEAEVIGQLNAENVEFAPKLICGGDFPDHKTVTHEYVGARWNKGRRKTHEPRVHHRFAVNLGQPLWKFRSSKHFMQILYDAFTCHRQAVERCRILHRDISAWNILWDEVSGRGILSDWDLSARMPPAGTSDVDPTVNIMAQLPTGSGKLPDRTGTWAFMSALALSSEDEDKLHDVQDDLESIFWVALYIIVLYYPFNWQHAVHIVDSVINQYGFLPSGKPYGGHGKTVLLNKSTADRSHSYSVTLPDTASGALGAWIGTYRRMIKEWVQYQEALKDWNALQSQPAGILNLLGAGPRPVAPDLRDHQALDEQWRLLLTKGDEAGLFKDKDRLFDEVHGGDPEQVLAQYRFLLKHERQSTVQLKATERREARRAIQQELRASQQDPYAGQQEPRANLQVLANSDSKQGANLSVVGPIDDAADDIEEEATRAAKRQRKFVNGLKRTSSRTAGQSGKEQERDAGVGCETLAREECTS